MNAHISAMLTEDLQEVVIPEDKIEKRHFMVYLLIFKPINNLNSYLKQKNKSTTQPYVSARFCLFRLTTWLYIRSSSFLSICL